MELVEGRTLREVASAGRLPLKKFLDVAIQIADGLARAHDRPRFLLEPMPALGVGREGGRKDFQRDITSEPPVAGTVDFAHAAGSERDTTS
jgi:hypothetical protein